jgi:hypothetical protein
MIRLTLDHGLEFYEQNSSPVRNLTRAFPVCDFNVLELKFQRDREARAVEILNRFPFRPVACSKYTLGITGRNPLK